MQDTQDVTVDPEIETGCLVMIEYETEEGEDGVRRGEAFRTDEESVWITERHPHPGQITEIKFDRTDGCVRSRVADEDGLTSEWTEEGTATAVYRPEGY